MQDQDQRIAVARLQAEIGQQLDLPMEKLLFEFHSHLEGVRLDLVTISPRHDQAFLYHSLEAPERTQALEQMLDYVSRRHQQKRSFTVQWSHTGDEMLQTSYFRARDMHEVLEKFSHGKDLGDYTIFAITMNPIA
ncbi:MAG: hypothetical protein AB8F95_00575 [Bacteroidia bacterium]